jgi:hypothetical protein
MSTINMPGFTAALSLEKTTFRYVSGQVESVTRRAAGMVPSLVLPPWSRCQWPCYVDHHGDCVCPGLGPPPPHGTFGL